jgi:hypothetical protein
VREAEEDLAELVAHITQYDSVEHANYVLEKPYRIIYEVIGHEVFILLIVDGRRSLQTILEQRLLR